jgi:hypothetical protein
MDSIREQMDLTNEISDAISNPVGMGQEVSSSGPLCICPLSLSVCVCVFVLTWCYNWTCVWGSWTKMRSRRSWRSSSRTSSTTGWWGRTACRCTRRASRRNAPSVSPLSPTNPCPIPSENYFFLMGELITLNIYNSSRSLCRPKTARRRRGCRAQGAASRFGHVKSLFTMSPHGCLIGTQYLTPLSRASYLLLSVFLPLIIFFGHEQIARSLPVCFTQPPIFILLHTTFPLFFSLSRPMYE